jgi:hypothetical protein
MKPSLTIQQLSIPVFSQIRQKWREPVTAKQLEQFVTLKM